MSTLAAPKTVLFVSLMVGVPILDRAGERVAAIRDLIARLDLEAREIYPPITGIVATISGREVFMPWALVERVGAESIRLSRAALNLARFERRPGEVLLARDVLDKQLVDVNGRRIIRASDIVLAPLGSQLRVVGVDVGAAAIWRRAAPRALGRRVVAADVIEWDDVEYLTREAPLVRLRGGHPKIARLHPVDIAQLVEDLPHRLGAEIVDALDDETAAEVVEELSDERQADIFERMDPERAADLLGEMDPDAAADVLGELSEEAAAELLAEMEPEDAADVRELLAHKEGTAGSIMNNEFAAVPAGVSAAEALEILRALPDRPSFLHEIYVIDGDEQIVGVVALPEVVFADPTTPLAELADEVPCRATLDMSAREAAELIAEYSLLTLPVVDDAGRMLGIVTFDDAMAELVPDADERRLPRLFR